MFRAGQVNFSKGEIGPQLYGRFDVDAYAAALKSARNVIVMKYGGVTKRPGMRLVAEVLDDSEPTRLMPFAFSLTQTYALEFGQGYMRPCANGGVILNEELEITAITNGLNAQITAAFHGYAVGEQVYLTGIDGALGDFLNGRFWTIQAVYDDDNFTIDADTSSQAVFSGADGGITRTVEPDPDPAPPVVPPPVDPPAPPSTGGGGGSFCVQVDTLILMADGETKRAGDMVVGDMVHTRHETTMEWGNYPVAAVEFEKAVVYEAEIGGAVLRATPGHRIWQGGKWVEMRQLGQAEGVAEIALITVADAHTYVSNGLLSHNIKLYDPDI